MKYDIFLSICQTEVDGYTPSESIMFSNFFDQVQLADELGYGTAWIAETHLSCQTQKETSNAVIPEFQGEIGLNTDVLQLAHLIFSKTKTINVGSAIRNILCNGGPVAHAEAIRTFLKLNELNNNYDRKLCIGFASGRFDFANEPYGIRPRADWEKVGWMPLKGKILSEAIEIFLRLLKGEKLNSSQIEPRFLSEQDFRSPQEWETCKTSYEKEMNLKNCNKIEVPKFWNFETLSLIPKEVNLESLDLTIGTHDEKLQALANQFLPVSVFNLSITPQDVIEKSHLRMAKEFHKDGGPWTRAHMPRTALIFIDETEGLSSDQQNQLAKEKAEKAWASYWKAMEGTLDPEKVKKAVGNAIYGNSAQVAQQIKEKYHPEDRLMLWFDFNNHDNLDIKKSMTIFMKKVVPLLEPR